MSSTTTARDYSTALICVRVGRDTIDPQGLGSDEDVEAAKEFILDAVREEFPGADVRSVGDQLRPAAQRFGAGWISVGSTGTSMPPTTRPSSSSSPPPSPPPPRPSTVSRKLR